MSFPDSESAMHQYDDAEITFKISTTVHLLSPIYYYNNHKCILC